MPVKPKAPKPTTEELLKHQEATLATRPPQLIERVTKLAKEQVELQNKKDKLKADTTANNILMEKLRGGPGQEGELPQAMQEAQVEELTLQDGTKILVDKILDMPSMAADSEKRQPVIDWLEANGHGGMVKNVVTVYFEKGDPKAAILDRVVKALRLQADKFAAVHSGSLKSLITTLLEEGKDVPMEELGISQYHRSEVKKAKVK